MAYLMCNVKLKEAWMENIGVGGRNVLDTLLLTRHMMS